MLYNYFGDFMNSTINDIELLEFKIKKLHSLKQEHILEKETSDLIDQKIKEYDDLLLKKYIELEQIKK